MWRTIEAMKSVAVNEAAAMNSREDMESPGFIEEVIKIEERYIADVLEMIWKSDNDPETAIEELIDNSDKFWYSNLYEEINDEYHIYLAESGADREYGFEVEPEDEHNNFWGEAQIIINKLRGE